MSTTVGVHEAKTHLSDLLRRVEAGETVMITRRGLPVAELRPPAPSGRRELGVLQGVLGLPASEIERLFVGADDDVARLFFGDEGAEPTTPGGA